METESNAVEGNRLIAEFLGGELVPEKQGNVYWFKDYHHFLTNHKALNVYALKYHSSWDWLIPVVEKIESMNYYFNISNSHVIVVNSENGYEYDDMYDSKIEAVWQAVVSFAKWYNKNK